MRILAAKIVSLNGIRSPGRSDPYFNSPHGNRNATPQQTGAGGSFPGCGPTDSGAGPTAAQGPYKATA